MPAASKPALSPERQALSDAIAELREFDARLAELRENEEMRAGQMYDATAALEQAEKELRDGHRLAIMMFETTPRTHYAEPPGAPDHLVLAAEIAREKDEVATTVRRQVRDELRTAEKEREEHERRVAKCAVEVIAKHAEKTGLSQKVADLQRQAADLGSQLLWLSHRHQRQSGPVISRAREDLAWRDLGDVTGGQAMEAALQALKCDATAEVG
jgi:hypothetical protein